MGAGYCDVVVTATSGGVSQIKALARSTIGGEDLLQNMMHHLLPNSENLFKNHGVSYREYSKENREYTLVRCKEIFSSRYPLESFENKASSNSQYLDNVVVRDFEGGCV
ncbi:hypothetical protein JHK85_001075 [Glycine max]|nr:hypothetical protein JHK87_001051 [Glycine soja]KAG5068698.1 hypothetical protein JHK85_001075 [Glycine max]